MNINSNKTISINSLENVLIIGNGGRENALAWAIQKNELIKKINYDLVNKVGLKESEFRLAGVLILFNNLLQSLFKSQILTLGLVMLGIFLMFIVLFKNIKLSLIGVVPNFIAAIFILSLIHI